LAILCCTPFAAIPIRSLAPPHATIQSNGLRSQAGDRAQVLQDWCAGYAGATFGQDTAELEILDLNGKVLRIGWEQVKWVCYVRDFPASSQGSDQANPERLLHKRFSIRPRTAGLWLRMTLTDGEELEGLAANDRSLVEGCRPAAHPARHALQHAAHLCAQTGHSIVASR